MLRTARPEDYDEIAAVVDDWWGRPVLIALPRLFLDYFHRTSVIATDSDGLAGFQIGFLPPDGGDEAYSHFFGVAPRARGRGLAQAIHERFLDMARSAGRSRVVGTANPKNTALITYYRRLLGYTAHGPLPNFNGPGRDAIWLERRL